MEASEDRKFDSLSLRTASMITDDQNNLAGLNQYLETTQYWARLAVLLTVFGEILKVDIPLTTPVRASSV